MHQWQALLDNDYSSVFEYNCKHYAHYLDATMGRIETIQSSGSDPNHVSGYTSTENDIFIRKGCYVGIDDVPIIFDSGCTIAVTPHLSDFICPPTPVNKRMKGLYGSVKVDRQGFVD